MATVVTRIEAVHMAGGGPTPKKRFTIFYLTRVPNTLTDPRISGTNLHSIFQSYTF